MNELNKKVNFNLQLCLKDKGSLLIDLDKSKISRAAYEKSAIFFDQLCNKHDYLIEHIENLNYYFMQLLVGLNIYNFKNRQLTANINFYDSYAFAEITRYICDELKGIREWGKFDEQQILNNGVIFAYGELYYNVIFNLHVNSMVADDLNHFDYNDYKNRFDFLKDIVCNTAHQELNSEDDINYINFYDDFNFNKEDFDSLWSDYDVDFKNYRDNNKVN